MTTRSWVDGVRPYLQKAPLAAFFLGLSSGFPYAMIGATLTTRLAQDGIDKKAVTAFSLAFLVYNLKFLWAWVVDGVKLPLLHRLGQRRAQRCHFHFGGLEVLARVARYFRGDAARAPVPARARVAVALRVGASGHG